MRKLVPIVTLAIFVSGCANPAREETVPRCDLENASVVLLVAQSVPTAQLVPCVANPASGWSVRRVDTGDDGARFQLHADDLGGTFLEVQLTDECPRIADAEQVVLAGGTARVARAVDVSIPQPISVAVAAAAAEDARTALSIAGELRAAGFAVDVPPVGTPVGERVATAGEQGQVVFVVGARADANGLLDYYSPGAATAEAVDPADVVELLEELEERQGVASYAGTWHYAVDGGCVIYAFDASGAGVVDLPEQVTEALSFVSRTRLNRLTRLRVGIDLDP